VGSPVFFFFFFFFVKVFAFRTAHQQNTAAKNAWNIKPAIVGYLAIIQSSPTSVVYEHH